MSPGDGREAHGAPLAPAILAAALLITAVCRPPEVEPWSRAVCQALAALGALVVTARAGVPRRALAGIVAALPFVAAAILTSACRTTALDEAADVALLILSGVLGRHLATTAPARRVMSGVLIVLGTTTALQGVLQHHWTYPRWAAALRAAGGGSAGVLGVLESGRPSGPFILPAALGGFLALCLPLALVRGIAEERRGATRVVILAGAGLQLYALALTRSIGALVALAVGSLAFLPVLPARRRPGVLAALALLVIAGGGLFAVSRRMESMARAGIDPLTLRRGNWGAALTMIEDHPLFGVGPGAFASHYPRTMRPGMNETRYAHNSYLQTVACWGLWIVVPIAGLLAAFARASATRAATAERCGLLAAGGSFLVHNAGDFTAYLPGVAVPAALLLGVALGASHDPVDPPSPTTGGGAVHPRARRLARRARLVVVAAAAVLYVAHAVVLARSRSFLLRASEAAEAGDRGRAMALARRAERGRAGDPDPPAFLAQLVLAERVDDPALRAEGRRAAERAVRADPEQAILHDTLALYEAAAGDPAAAWQERFRAHELYPLKPQYRLPPADAGAAGAPAGGGAP